jgi:hypothetical protein
MESRPAPKPDSELRRLGHTGLGLLFWMATFVVAARVLDRHPESAAVRGLLVALGALGCGTCAWTLRRLIVNQDEYSRRVHISALALAFAISLGALFITDLMLRAGFVSYVPLEWMWIGMIVIWWPCIFIVDRYYR